MCVKWDLTNHIIIQLPFYKYYTYMGIMYVLLSYYTISFSPFITGIILINIFKYCWITLITGYNCRLNKSYCVRWKYLFSEFWEKKFMYFFKNNIHSIKMYFNWKEILSCEALWCNIYLMLNPRFIQILVFL